MAALLPEEDIHTKCARMAVRYFPSTVGQKWIKIDIAENFKKNMSTQGSEDTHS